jgi:hypothetical protein
MFNVAADDKHKRCVSSDRKHAHNYVVNDLEHDYDKEERNSARYLQGYWYR